MSPPQPWEGHHRGPAVASSAWCPLKAERAGELPRRGSRSQAGDPGVGSIEPLARRFGACAVPAAAAAAATAPPGSAEPLPIADPDDRSHGRRPRTLRGPARPEPSPAWQQPSVDGSWLPARSRRPQRTPSTSGVDQDVRHPRLLQRLQRRHHADNVSSPRPRTCRGYSEDTQIQAGDNGGYWHNMHERKCLSVMRQDNRLCTRLPACIGRACATRARRPQAALPVSVYPPFLTLNVLMCPSRV